MSINTQCIDVIEVPIIVNIHEVHIPWPVLCDFIMIAQYFIKTIPLLVLSVTTIVYNKKNI